MKCTFVVFADLAACAVLVVLTGFLAPRRRKSLPIVYFSSTLVFLAWISFKLIFLNWFSSHKNLRTHCLLLKMGLSGASNKLSLVSKLKLLESLDKMVKSLKFMLQSQVRNLSEKADGLTFLRCLFVKCEFPICSAALT